jgi:O-antigen/teichoic acid export membrane protein
MSSVKRNVVANLLGGVLLAALTLVITPLQINILGMEAYGVVGFITTLQIAFTAFDFGLSSTITREVATDNSEGKRGSDALLRTASTIYWLTALVIGLIIASLAGFIASRWFNSESIDVLELEQSLQVIALYLALRWPVSLYIGVLSGLQRMDALNIVKVGTAALRLIGGIFILLHWRSLYAFLVWTAINALVEVAVYWMVCQRLHPSMPLQPGVSWEALQKVWRFSLSMNGLAILTVLIVQFDRLLISKMLTLEALGAYMLAYNTAAVIPALISAASTAVLPAYAALHGSADTSTLPQSYDNASRLLIYGIGMTVGALVFFGEPLLAAWVNAAAAAAAAMPLALLAIGYWGSAAASNAYQVAVASGRPNLALKISALSAPPYFLGLYLLVSIMGINGAALAWLLLNGAYVVFLVPRVHRQVLHIPVLAYFTGNLLPFAAVAAIAFGLFGGIAAKLPADMTGLALALLAGACGLYALAGYFLVGVDNQQTIRSSLRRASQMFWLRSDP